MQNQFSNSAHQQSNQMQPKSQNCPKRNTPHKVSKKLKTISQPAEKKQETKSNTRRKKKGNPNRKAKTNTTNRRKKKKKMPMRIFQKIFRTAYLEHYYIFCLYVFSPAYIHCSLTCSLCPSPFTTGLVFGLHCSP